MRPLTDGEIDQRREDVENAKDNGFALANQTARLLTDLVEQVSLSNHNLSNAFDMNHPSHFRTLIDRALLALETIADRGEREDPLHIVLTKTDNRFTALSAEMQNLKTQVDDLVRDYRQHATKYHYEDGTGGSGQ